MNGEKIREFGQDGLTHQSGSELPRMRFRATVVMVIVLIACFGLWIKWHPFRGADDLLVVGYDSSREYITEASQLYVQIHGRHEGRILSNHSGSVQQVGNLARGLAADIVFLGSEAEMETVQRQTACIEPDWERVFPHGGSPVYSTIVLLVRTDNPLGLSDWKDLYSRDVQVAVPDPRHSGAGRYAYLALMADAMERHENDFRMAEGEVRSLMMRIKLIPHGAHSAMDVFARNTRLDAFLTWESEAIRVTKAEQSVDCAVVYPAASIKAEPVVAVMTCQTERRATTEAARSFIEFLYSNEGQEVAVKNGLRPRMIRSGFDGRAQFHAMELREVEAVFGSWESVWRDHLGPEGSFAYAMTIRSAREGGVE